MAGKPMDVDNVPPAWIRPRRWWDTAMMAGTIISLFGFMSGVLNFQNGIIDAQWMPWYQQGNALYQLVNRGDTTP